MSLSITIIIIIITAIISFMAFNNRDLMEKLIFYPPDINRGQWYRFFSNGLIHADIGHLVFNMLSLYFFGDYVSDAFTSPVLFGNAGNLLYIILYVSALAVCLIPTYMKNKDNYHYRSLGASGAVSAVVFAGILLFPTAKLSLLFLPIPIPGFIFGPLYLIITAYLDKRGGGGINHSAHLWGALYGIAFVVALSFALNTGFNPLTNFIRSVQESFMK